jgi:hypothetical protein
MAGLSSKIAADWLQNRGSRGVMAFGASPPRR